MTDPIKPIPIDHELLTKLKPLSDLTEDLRDLYEHLALAPAGDPTPKGVPLVALGFTLAEDPSNPKQYICCSIGHVAKDITIDQLLAADKRLDQAMKGFAQLMLAAILEQALSPRDKK